MNVRSMSNFERELVRSFNAFFGEQYIEAIAYRIKQHRYSQQMLDILVDSSDYRLYLGIECKSISPSKGATALYFSQHFSVNKRGEHQVAKMQEFIRKSGRAGYLAVELRMGSGKSKAAYFITWPEVWRRYNEKQAGFSIEEIRNSTLVAHNDGHYAVEGLFGLKNRS
jgi:Holliday junction resolvase